jgi:cytochrome c551/c552
MKLIKLFILIMFFFSSSMLYAGIVDTKHNLSVTSSGTIKATSETEICVFCHIPHQAKVVGGPLWNRNMPTSNYTMYDSDYLRRLGYPAVAADLGSANNTPGALSRQCLSCHDGTVAIGSVHKLRGRDATIDMNVAGGLMPGSEAGFIGTDLSVHHPIGIEYDTAPTRSPDTGTYTTELKATADSPVKLFEYSGYPGKYLECSSCHDPHKQNGKFLHVDTGANHGQNVVGTCTSCHEKDGWVGSVHQSPPGGSPNYTDADLIAKYGTANISDLGCVNCHTPHNAVGSPYILR